MAMRHFLTILAVTFIWAFNNIAVKLGLVELPPLFLTWMRFVVVATLLVPFCPITFQQLPWLIILSFTFGFMHFSLLFLGLVYTDAGTGAVIVQLGTPIAMLLATVVLKERLRLIQILGIITSLSGVVVLSGSPTIPSWRVLFILICSATGWAISNLIVKRIPSIKPVTMIGWTSLCAVPIVGFFSFFLESNQLYSLSHATWRGWFSILYSAIASSITGYTLWYTLLKKYHINVIMPYSLLTPVLSVFMGIIFLEDTINIFKVIGASLVIFGTAIAVINSRKARNDH
jgi:O-acetylserine/cysteine efflux transporter